MRQRNITNANQIVVDSVMNARTVQALLGLGLPPKSRDYQGRGFALNPKP